MNTLPTAEVQLQILRTAYFNKLKILFNKDVSAENSKALTEVTHYYNKAIRDIIEDPTYEQFLAEERTKAEEGRR